MTVRDDRGDVKQTTTGFRGPLMVQSLTSAKSKFLSLNHESLVQALRNRRFDRLLAMADKSHNQFSRVQRKVFPVDRRSD